MRVDFYEMAGRFQDPLEVAAVLVGKAWPETRDIAVVGAAPQLAEFDDRLWKVPSGRFLPHGIGDELAPIRLLESAPASAALLINLDPAGPMPEGRFERVLEIVPPEESARAHLRERWKAWTSAGAELHHHKLK